MESEIRIFNSFTARDMEIQGQLHEAYKCDRYLEGRLKEGIYIPAIREFLKDRPVETSHELINRVANHLYERPKTAGEVYANWAAETPGQNMALYNLGKSYVGEAWRPRKTFGKGR